MTRKQRAIDDDAMIELAALLARGAALPPDLQSLREDIEESSEARARLEHYQSWWNLLSEAANGSAHEPQTLLILRVRREPRLQIEVVHREGWIRTALQLDASGRTRPQQVVDSILRLGEVDVSFGSDQTNLTVQLRGSAQRTSGVRIEASTMEAEPLVSTRTDASGSATVSFAGEPEIRLALIWDDPHPHESDVEIDQI